MRFIPLLELRPLLRANTDVMLSLRTTCRAPWFLRALARCCKVQTIARPSRMAMGSWRCHCPLLTFFHSQSRKDSGISGTGTVGHWARRVSSSRMSKHEPAPCFSGTKVAASCSRLNLQRSHTCPTSRTDWISWVLTATPRPQVEASVA